MLRATAVGLPLLLAACDGGGPGMSFGAALTGAPATTGSALTQTTLAAGDIVLTGPEGYCIDPTSLRSRTLASFALLAACRDLTGDTAAPYAPPAIMTVTVGARRSGLEAPDPATLADTLAPLGIRDRLEIDGLTIFHLDQGGDSRAEGAAPRHWRSAIVVDGRLVSLAVYGSATGNVADVTGGALLRDLARGIRRDNAQPATVAQTATTPPPDDAPGTATPQARTQTNQTSGDGATGGSLLRRLFNRRG